jgi:hypothetical protein
MRKLGLIAIGLSLVFFLLLVWYWATYSMDEARSFEIGNANAPQSLLIAFQGSVYKNSVVEQIAEHFSTSDIHIKGIDIQYLSNIDPDDYNAIFITHTWQIWQAPEAVERFIDDHPMMNHYVLLCTSESGNGQLENVDAITSASVLTSAHEEANNAIIKLEELID